MKLPLNDVMSFLENDQLNVQSELDVYEATVKWLEHDKEKRIREVFNVMCRVRLPLLSAEDLVHRVGHNPLVLASPECVQLLMEAVQCHLLPDSKEKVCGFVI